MALTRRENQVLDFIRQYVAQHSYAPTGAEIANSLGIQSRGVVYRYLKRLQAGSYIELEAGRRRNIRLLPRLPALPFLGAIAAGRPIEAVPQQESMDFNADFFGPGRYLLRVVGDSMIDEGILDGDLIICRAANTARDGEIVIALVNKEETTLKRIHYNHDKKIVLLPGNKNYSPQIYRPEQVEVQGTFVGLIRKADS